MEQTGQSKAGKKKNPPSSLFSLFSGQAAEATTQQLPEELCRWRKQSQIFDLVDYSAGAYLDSSLLSLLLVPLAGMQHGAGVVRGNKRSPG